jgi:hypothetical protein
MKWLLETTNVLLLVVIALVVAVLLQARCYHASEPPPPVTGTCDAANIAAGAAGCPRLEQAALSYVGGFRMPLDGADWSYAQFGGMDLNATATGLYVSNGYYLCEINIPELVNNADPNVLPLAQWRQACVRPGDGQLEKDMGTSDIKLGSPLLFGQYVVQSVYWYFDSSAQQVKTHFRHAATLATTGAYRGIATMNVAPATEAGWISTIMGHIAPEWQTALGGKALAGGGGIPIINRQPYGFSLYSFDPAQVNVAPEPVPTTMVLGHDESHKLGEWGVQSNVWNGSSVYHGIAMVNGTRTTLVGGFHGKGPWCYGNGGTQNPPPPGENCYDPTIPAHGTHAYPYVYRLWAFDTRELAEVKAGKREPWNVQPYGNWDITFPTPSCCPIVMGLAYDTAKQLLYLMQSKVHGYDHSLPAVHAFHVTVPASHRASS